MDVLVRIKRLALARRVEFTLKAEQERLWDNLTVDEVLESIMNATVIKKTLRSRSRGWSTYRDRLHVIESPTYTGRWIYTKGTLRRKVEKEVFYVLVSSKLAQ